MTGDGNRSGGIVGAEVIVSVGTDHHPFDRLVRWADGWAEANPQYGVFIQHGSTAPPAFADGAEMVGFDDLIAAMADARAVVTQGGPATIADARAVGHRPIVVPRHGSRGEHVDDHQVRFCRWMAERDLIHLAEDEARLVELLDLASSDPGALRIEPDDGPVAETIGNFAALVDPLIAQGRSRRNRRGRRR